MLYIVYPQSNMESQQAPVRKVTLFGVWGLGFRKGRRSRVARTPTDDHLEITAPVSENGFYRALLENLIVLHISNTSQGAPKSLS